MAVTTNTWAVNADGDFDTASNWSAATVPDSNNDAVINTASIHTITHGGNNDTVNSLTVGNDHFVLSGGSLSLVAGASFALDYTQTGGSLLGAGTVSITGNGTLTGGYAGNNIAFKIGGTIALGNYTLGGAALLENDTTVNQTAQVTIGDNTGVNATINNTSAATYNISNDSGISQGAVSGIFTNAGLLEKTAGSGTSTIGANVNDTGTITVATGTLQFTGATNSFAGLVNGSGTFLIGSGANTIATGTKIQSATFDVYGNATNTTLTLGGALYYTGAFNEGYGATINLNGKTLTLTGAVDLFNSNFGTPTIDGSGKLATSGTTTVAMLLIGGSVAWTNTGTVNETGTLQIGDSGSSAATVTNASAGTYSFTNDSGISLGTVKSSTFINQGTLTKTGGTGTSVIGVDVVDTGTISVTTGTIELTGPTNSISGTISGAGQFVLGGGSADTIVSGTTISASVFSLTDSGTTVTLGGFLSYAGTFNMSGSTIINLAGRSLTLSGPTSLSNSNFGTPTITGSGTLTTSGTTTVNYFTLGGTVAWRNTGTVNQINALQVGDGSTSAATFINASSGTYNLTIDAGIAVGTVTSSSFTNQGTLAKVSGIGKSVVSVNIVDTGTIAVGSGTLDFAGATNTFSGTISGAGTFEVSGSGNNTIASGTKITVSSFVIDNDVGGLTVTLGGFLSYAGTFSETFGSTIDLGGHGLTLTGAATFANANFGTPSVDGSGALATSGTTTLGGFVLGGSVTWKNSGTLTELGGNLTLGDGSSNSVTFTNSKVFNITDNSGMSRGASTLSNFVNSGTFEKTAGTGTSVIVPAISNTGTILVSSGTFDLQGAVTGTGAMTISGASNLELDGPVSGQTVSFTGSGGDLILKNPTAFATSSSITGFGASDTLDVGSPFGSGTTVTFFENANGKQGNLTITNGSTKTEIVLNGTYTASGFGTANDGSGGTSITYTPPAATARAAPSSPTASSSHVDWSHSFRGGDIADGSMIPTSGSPSDFVQALFDGAFGHSLIDSAQAVRPDPFGSSAAIGGTSFHAESRALHHL